MKDFIKLSCVFACSDINKTASFYEKNIGFTKKEYLTSKEPHICLYCENIEIILIDANHKKVFPNHVLYGYGYDAYIYTKKLNSLYESFKENNNIKIVKPLYKSDYNNNEIVIEDLDGRYIAFGYKEK